MTVSDAGRLSITTGTRSMRIARRQGKAYVWIPLVVALMFVAAAWLHGRWWLAPAGVVVSVLMVYAPPLLGCLLARSGVGGRVLLYESNQHGRARVTIRVQRRGLLRRGRRYVLLWNLASAPAPGQDPPERAARAGWVVMSRAIAMAQAAGLDLRLQATNWTLADDFYAPMGFVLEQPQRPGSAPWMVLYAPPRQRGRGSAASMLISLIVVLGLVLALLAPSAKGRALGRVTDTSAGGWAGGEHGGPAASEGR